MARNGMSPLSTTTACAGLSGSSTTRAVPADRSRTIATMTTTATPPSAYKDRRRRSGTAKGSSRMSFRNHRLSSRHVSRTSGHSGLATRAAVAIGAIAAFLFLTARHLNTPGLYYDELHQAIAAFDYIGRHYPSFNHEFHGVPILNMSYSGAIKSNVYGLYLRFVEPHFTVVSWRLLGLLFAAGGLGAFYAATGRAL